MEYKPTITFDLDDVLCDVTRPFVAWHNERYGTNLLFEDILGDNLHELLGLTKGEEFDRWLEFFALPQYMDIVPDPETVMVLERLREHFKIIIVSARNPLFQPFAKPWLEKYLDNLYDEILFIKHKDGTKRSKGEVCKEVESVLHVDDEPRHYVQCKAHGIKFIMFSAPWNMDSAECDGRIDTLGGIYKHLPL